MGRIFHARFTKDLRVRSEVYSSERAFDPLTDVKTSTDFGQDQWGTAIAGDILTGPGHWSLAVG